MSVIAAIAVVILALIAGLLGGAWRIMGVVGVRADRLGVGPLRGGLLVERVRLPLLLWACGFAVLGVLVAAAFIGHTVMRVGVVAALGVLLLGVVVLPRVAPLVLARAGRAVGGRVARAARRRH